MPMAAGAKSSAWKTSRAARRKRPPSYRLKNACGITAAPHAGQIRMKMTPERPPLSIGWSKRLHFPRITARAALPVRTQRHVPDSLATLRYELAAALAAKLERCPCCTRPAAEPRRWRKAA